MVKLSLQICLATRRNKAYYIVQLIGHINIIIMHQIVEAWQAQLHQHTSNTTIFIKTKEQLNTFMITCNQM